MTLRLYNTLTKTKEDFIPLDPKNVRMYVCGPTVYDYAHIGNARPAIVFDVLYRLLKHLAKKGEWDGGKGETEVTYVRNITDVDDKINARAAEQFPHLPLNEAIRSITEKTAQQYFDDVAALGCLTPDEQPRATNYIEHMIAMIKKLVDLNYAYPEQGHVLFDVSKKSDYGKLARRSLDEMMAGARVEVAPYKKNPMDFVLWKPSDPSQPGWESPWGRGRPGWHIECSAMSEALLCTPFNTDTFDIHGGGIDLVFPHHENEIAQSESAHRNHPFAKVWMHNGFLQVEGEKMSKSLGNFFTIHDLLKDWPGEVLRFNMLRTHYRQPIDWTLHGLQESFDNYFNLFDVADRYVPSSPDEKFLDALRDDLNSPQAISRLHELRQAAEKGDIESGAALGSSLALIGCKTHNREAGFIIPQLAASTRADVLSTFMVLFPRNYPITRVRNIILKSQLSDVRKEVSFVLQTIQCAGASVRAGDVERLSEEVLSLNERIDARNAARKAKNFKESDRIRDELLAKGIVLKDGPNGTTWEVKR